MSTIITFLLAPTFSLFFYYFFLHNTTIAKEFCHRVDPRYRTTPNDFDYLTTTRNILN